MRKTYKRTLAQRRRMSEAQKARHAKRQHAELNGDTIPIGDAVKAVALANQLVSLMGKSGALSIVGAI